MKNLIKLFLSTVLFLFTSTYCTKKGDDNKQGTSSTTEPVEDLKKSFDKADKAMNEMMDQMSMTGFQDQQAMNKLLDNYTAANDKLKKFELCGKILMAKVSYDLRSKLKKEIPKLNPAQKETITQAEQHCTWAGEQVNKFESTLSDQDYVDIAKNVPHSLVPFQKRLFSSDQNCTKEEFTGLLKMNRNLYTDSRVISSILIVTTVKKSGDMDSYLPLYRKKLEDSSFPEKEFLLGWLATVDESTKTLLVVERKKQMLAKAMNTFTEAGIKDVPNFLKTSVKAAPKCFSSISSGVIDLSKLVITGDNLKTLHVRLKSEINRIGSMPKMEPVKEGSEVMELNSNFIAKLKSEKIAVKDEWHKPLFVIGKKENFKVVSSGKDRVVGTNDDLNYPRL